MLSAPQSVEEVHYPLLMKRVEDYSTIKNQRTL